MRGMVKMVGRKYIAPVIIGVVFFSWVYSMDFTNFYLPESPVIQLYSYTLLFLAIGIIALMYFRVVDRKLPVEKSALRNGLKTVLASLWLIDGILQMQPQMPFGFSHFVLQPSIQSLPVFVYGQLSGLPAFWNSSPIIFNAIASAIQLFLGIALLVSRSQRSVRTVAFLSLLWALIIWVLAEGMGGIFQPGLSLMSGFPGAAFLYLVISAMLLSRSKGHTLHAYLRIVFVSLFLLGALIQVIPAEGFWTGSGISSVPGAFIIDTQPHLLSIALLSVAQTMEAAIILWNFVFTALFLLTGIIWIVRPRIAAFATIIVTPVFWFIGQDFGVFGMYGTDPNTGLPIMLMSVVYLIFNSAVTSKTTIREKTPMGTDNAGNVTEST